MDYGFFKGEVCRRNRCPGIIDERDTDGSCICHLGFPPCSYCTKSREYCPKCQWDGYDEQMGEVWPITNERRGLYAISVLTPKGAEQYVEDFTRSQAIIDMQEMAAFYQPICRNVYYSDGTISINISWRLSDGLYMVSGSFKWAD